MRTNQNCPETAARERMEVESNSESAWILGAYERWHAEGNFDKGMLGFLQPQGFLPQDDGDPYFVLVV